MIGRFNQSGDNAWIRIGVWAPALLLLGFVTPAAGNSFSHVVSFGDSLSDTGNLYETTSNPINAILLAFLFLDLEIPIPPPPYFDGRFSNGPVWIERLADRLGLGATVASESGGFNFAVGGAKTANDDVLNFILSDDGADQVDAYLDGHTSSGNELFIVEGGANDLLSGGQADVTIPTGSLAGSLQDLYLAGGRNFLVPNLPPLGQIPDEVGGTEEQVLDARSVAFNDDLQLKLDNLAQALPDINIFVVDFYATMKQVLADPAGLGFTNVRDPAFDTQTKQVVSNPNEYLF